jgi:hypothetical protein
MAGNSKRSRRCVDLIDALHEGDTRKLAAAFHEGQRMCRKHGTAPQHGKNIGRYVCPRGHDPIPVAALAELRSCQGKHTLSIPDLAAVAAQHAGKAPWGGGARRRQPVFEAAMTIGNVDDQRLR